MPTGTTPSASGTSWLAQLTVATRSGLASIVVVPRACSMVTGNCAAAEASGVEDGVAEDAEELDSPHPLSVTATTVISEPARGREKRTGWTLSSVRGRELLAS